jgi:glutathione S-transferase
MITLYHAPRSRSSRMIWLLEELGAPYEIHPVSIYRFLTGEGAPDATNPHPDRRVPAILHGEDLIAESIAIVLYLTETFPQAGLGPLPGQPQRGAYLTWVAWYAAELEPVLMASLTGSMNPPMQRRYEAVIHRLETALTLHPYIMGDHFTGADLLICSSLVFGRKFFPATKLFDDYIALCTSRPAARKAVTLDEASGLQRAA